MNFNFSNLNNTNFTSQAGQYLKPYGIYSVNLTKIEKDELKGKDGTIYPIIKLEFTGVGESKGIFETNLFIPTSDKDMERRTVTNSNGHESKRPSSFENFQYTLMQIVEVLNPKGAEKIKENGDKIKTIDQFIDLIFKALKGKENVTTNLKLVGRNNQGKIFAALPSACGLNKKDEIFATNFIGENLFFSNYEETQQKAYRNATPTSMPSDSSDDENPDKGEDVDLDIDLDE
jgi:hypothetical protein